MALTPGQRLGAYEVVSALGAGGMGEVYRARDTKLQREVAIKVLPESLATDRDSTCARGRSARAVPFEDTPTFAPRTPVRLFDWPTLSVPGPARTYDVSRDGQRFLMIKEGAASEGVKAPPAAISVSLNWIQELKEKLSAK